MTASQRGCALLLATLLGASAEPALADEPQPVSSGIAVMPFEGTWAGAASGNMMARKIAQQLAALSALRVVPPNKVGVAPGASPLAEQVRGWASRLAVDSILLGRIVPDGDAQVVEVDLLSGHSGGPIAEHRGSISEDGDIDRVAGLLANALLEDLGVPLSAPLAAVAAPAPGGDAVAAESSGEEPSEDEESGIRFSSRDEPLAIDSDELELIENEDSRLFIFTRNVRVTQGDIQLTTEKLEAFYETGASQPQRLVATGNVKVLQGERHATCDRAVYLRDDQTVECSGHAELIQDCDRVRGPRIQFDLERERVRVLGGASVLIQPDSAKEQGCPGEGA